MTDEQHLKWLGPERFKIWKHGNLKLDKFIPPYPDKRLTVDALKKMDQDSFKDGVLYQAQRERLGDSVMIVPNGKGNYPQGGKFKKLKPYYDAASKGQEIFIKKLQKEKPEIEYAAVWDKDGDLCCVAYGKEGHVCYKVPDGGGIVIHNHPKGTPPSMGDLKEILDKKLTKMAVVTPSGKFNLTMDKEKGILSTDVLQKRFNNTIGDRDFITFEEWKEVLNGSGIKIDFVGA